MPINDRDAGGTYNERIAVLPGDPRIAYRPGVVIVNELARRRLEEITDRPSEPIFGREIDPEFLPLGQWHAVGGVPDAPGVVETLRSEGLTADLDIVYFANNTCCGTCPPHPALAVAIAANPWGANPWGANPWGANPWGANPWGANPWGANPWGANPWGANAEALNIVATGKAPTSSVMPALGREFPKRPKKSGTRRKKRRKKIRIGVLDSGLAGGRWNNDGQRPTLLGLEPADLKRIRGQLDLPSQPMNGRPADRYVDPVAGHGTFIAGIIEQLTPGCRIRVRSVFEPEGDVSVSALAPALVRLMKKPKTAPTLVNFSFGGTGRAAVLEQHIRHYHGNGVVFVGSAGNEGSCVEQYPAAMPEVVGVAALGPTGPAPWSNYGPWIDASAPGTDLVSSFFADFNGDLPRINGVDPDEFRQWATWSGTSFAGPVVVAALAREMVMTGCTAKEAVQAVVRAPHLARFPNMGTVVNL